MPKRKPKPVLNDEDLPEPKTRAGRNIKWCQDYLFIPEGKSVGNPLRMADFMTSVRSTVTQQDRRAVRLLVEAARTQRRWKQPVSSCSTCAALRQEIESIANYIRLLSRATKRR